MTCFTRGASLAMRGSRLHVACPYGRDLSHTHWCAQVIVVIICYRYYVYDCYVMLQVMGVCDDVVVNVYSTEILFPPSPVTW